MGGRRLLPYLLVAGADVLLLQVADGPAARTQTHRAVSAAAGLALLILIALAAALWRFVFRPLEDLGREIRIVGVNPAHTLELPRHHFLGGLPAAIHDL